MTPTERDIAATLRALTEGRIGAPQAAATLAAVVIQAERIAYAEGYHAGVEAAARVCHGLRAYGTERVVRRLRAPSNDGAHLAPLLAGSVAMGEP